MFHSKNSPLFRLIQRVQPTENTALLILAITVGVATGFSVWFFRLMIEVFHNLFQFEFLQGVLGPFTVIVSVATGGLIVGWIMNRYVGEERHHGVAGIMEAVALAGGRLRYRRMPFKALASALSLGAGASVGPEDPSVQIGSNIGSFFGQRLHLSEERMRLVVAAGAASAIAAAFNAPIAGVFFALEVVLGEFTTSAFGVVVLSAVLSSVTLQAADQITPLNEPALNLLNYSLGSLTEMPLFVVLGLAFAPVAALFIKVIYWMHDTWHHRVHLPRPIQTALVGAAVGVVGIYLPEILGAGREAMNAVLSRPDEFTLDLLIILCAAKIIMTAFSMAGGFVGGVFAPTLFAGLMLGGAFGRLVDSLNIQAFAVSDPQAYAIVGMAAMMAGVVRSPITAIMLVFELTNDYRLILPIMLASVVCIILAERFVPSGIYALGLARKGVHLQQGRDVDVMQGITVGEAMLTPAPQINENEVLLKLRDQLRHYNIRSLCVVNDAGKLVGIVTLSDLQRAYEEQPQDCAKLKVADICTRDVVTAHPDDVLWAAIRNMGARDIGRLPVVDEDTNDLVGMISRHDIVHAYNTAIARKLQDQFHAEQIRLNTLTGAHVFEMRIHQGAPIINMHIADVKWPAESVVASVLRKGKLQVPHGSTELKPGDLVTVVANPEVEDELAMLFGERPVMI
ncbi:MAG: chloride channel protein [Anaerolineae bacterium]|nr:chloride channel protein [Anaerolineae bacterium]